MEKKKFERVKTFIDYCQKMDYREPPVPIDKFVKDDQYLGKVTARGQTVYPVWQKALNKIFEDDSKILVVFTGAIGTGKTTIALIAMTYVMYRLLCLRDPWVFYEKTLGGKMGVSFFNLTKSLGESRGFVKLQNFLTSSPWFRKHSVGMPRARDRTEYLDFPLFRYLLASPYSKGFGYVGEDLICGLMDEVDTPTESIKQKERVLKAYEAAVRRFESRFATEGYSLGRLFLVASKQDDISFLNTFIAKMQGSEKVLVFDVPLWEAQPKHLFTGVTFNVAVGDAFHQPRIMPEEESEDDAMKEGYQVIAVPIEFKDEFQRDLMGSLRDLAGISVAGMRKTKLFASEKFVHECFDPTKLDPVTLPTIIIGLEDEVQLLWYLDVKKIRMSKTIQRYVHVDIAFTGDALGLAMSGIKDWVQADVQNAEGVFTKQTLPLIETDFVMRIKARPGDRIPLHRVRKLMLDLKALQYRLKFSADLKLASEDTTQILTKAGIETKYISVDKDDKAYVMWRNLVYEKRWICHSHAMLLFEAKHLEHNLQTAKVDHPKEVKDIEVLETGDVNEVVMEGSKDLTDAVVGSIKYCLEDMQAPMDMRVMSDVMARAIGEAPKSATKGLLLKDSSGKDVVAIKSGSGADYKRVSDIIKRLY